MTLRECIEWLLAHGYVGIEHPTRRQLGCITPRWTQYTEDVLSDFADPTTRYARWPTDRRYRIEIAGTLGDTEVWVFEVDPQYEHRYVDDGNCCSEGWFCCSGPACLLIGRTAAGIEADILSRPALARALTGKHEGAQS